MLYDVLRRIKGQVNIMMWLTIILALVIVSGVYTYARYTYHKEVTGVTVTVPGIGYCAYNGMTLADCVLVTDADEPYKTVSAAKTAIEAKTEVTSFSEVATTDEGLYDAEDDYGTSYYYRGAVEDNYVEYAGYIWRIIRVNGDGSVRMIYDGTTAHANGESSTDRYYTTSAFNSSYNDNAYVGYMYGATSASSYDEAHTNTNDSTIKGVIDGFYTSKLDATTTVDSEGNKYSAYLSDTLFCNDRSVYSGTGAGTTTSYYNGRNRLYTNKSPVLTCTNQNDRFTVSDTTTGNGDLTYPIGLITADEVAMAGGVYNTSNSSYYLYIGSYYWTMTPYLFTGSRAYGFYVDSTGYILNVTVNYSSGARPVVNLSADVYVYSGTGTQDDPYQVSLTKREIPSGCNGELSCEMLLNSTGEKTVSAAESAIEEKGDPDFSEMAPAISSYTDNLPTRITTVSASSRSMSSYSSRYYTYASSYTFDTSTGKYTLNNPSVGQYSSIYSSLGGKYVVSYSGSTSSSAATSTNLSTIYYVTTSTTSSTLYYISSTKTTNYDYSGDGLYAAEDDYGISYYYRGAVEDNYVSFAGYTWRIIRRNGDGSVRIIMEDNLDYVAYNNDNDSPKYVGYTYGNDDSDEETMRENDNDSTIKQYVDSWYSTNIEGTEYESYLSDELFCNDRTLSTDYTWSNFTVDLYGEYSSYQRLTDLGTYSPTLKCSNKLDQFTTTKTTLDDGTEVGNGYLKYPVGLITADEVVMAGNISYYVNYEYNTNYYLYNNDYWWTMTPAWFDSGAYVWDGYIGILDVDYVFGDYGARPVVNLSSEVLAESGTGTVDDPYTLALAS